MANLQKYRSVGTIRSAAILTNSYVAATVIDTTNDTTSYNQLTILGKYTKGSLTSLELKIEVSDDGTNYHQEVNESVSAGTTTMRLAEHTLTDDGNFFLPVPIIGKYIKISAKGTGTVTSSSLQLSAILSY